MNTDPDASALTAIRWVNRNLSYFEPISQGQPDSEACKAFSELSLVYSYLTSRMGGDVASHLSPWRKLLLTELGNPVFAQLPRKFRVVAFGYLIPYLNMRGLGYRDEYYEETIRQAKERGMLRAWEVVPFRILDREHTLWKSGCQPEEPDWEGLYAATPLATCKSALNINDEIMYSITHTVFYMTDFGERESHWRLVESERVIAVLDRLLVHNWRIGNWDLLGEVLISILSLRDTMSSLEQAAHHAYMAAWRSDGAMPARRSFSIVEARDEIDQRHRDFRQCYHSTLVALLYWMMACAHRALL